MMDCSAQPNKVKCDPNSDEYNNPSGCGSDIAFPYFISFYVLCSFLVRFIRSRILLDDTFESYLCKGSPTIIRALYR